MSRARHALSHVNYRTPRTYISDVYDASTPPRASVKNNALLLAATGALCYTENRVYLGKKSKIHPWITLIRYISRSSSSTWCESISYRRVLCNGVQARARQAINCEGKERSLDGLIGREFRICRLCRGVISRDGIRREWIMYNRAFLENGNLFSTWIAGLSTVDGWMDRYIKFCWWVFVWVRSTRIIEQCEEKFFVVNFIDYSFSVELILFS